MTETVTEVTEETSKETTEEKSSKLNSRKFIVWLVQTIMSFLVIIFSLIVLFVLKDISETTIQALIKVIEGAMGYFTLISGVYMGVNFGQKVGLGFAEALKSKTEEGEK